MAGEGGEDVLDRITDVNKADYRHFTFVESCQLPKPWTTERYPHIGREELSLLNSFLGSGT
jgi:hypothetical protein